MHLKRHVGPILAFLCFLAVPLAAQNGSIRGQVIDSVTQQGLAGATVQLVFRTAGLTVQPGRQVATDAEGRFTLNDVAPGTATVKVTLIGFGKRLPSFETSQNGICVLTPWSVKNTWYQRDGPLFTTRKR